MQTATKTFPTEIMKMRLGYEYSSMHSGANTYLQGTDGFAVTRGCLVGVDARRPWRSLLARRPRHLQTEKAV
eukprot:2356858-Pyramimonas_sp.AAC.1